MLFHVYFNYIIFFNVEIVRILCKLLWRISRIHVIHVQWTPKHSL